MFEGWATSQKVDLINTPCRSFLNLIFYFLTKDMDDEGRDNFTTRLEQIQDEAERIKRRTKRRQEQAANPDAPPPPPEGKVMKNGWVMPEGWTPPGWNEERSMQVAQQFMGFKANPK